MSSRGVGTLQVVLLFFWLITFLVLTKAAPANQEEREWRLIGQTEDDEDEPGNIMELSDDVIIEALFNNLDTLQDELEICEERLRLKLLGVDDENSEVEDNKFVDDPEDLLSKIVDVKLAGNISTEKKGNDATVISNGPTTISSNSIVTTGSAHIAREYNTDNFINMNSTDHLRNEMNATITSTTANNNNSSSSRNNNNNKSTSSTIERLFGSEIKDNTNVLDFHGDLVPFQWNDFQNETTPSAFPTSDLSYSATINEVLHKTLSSTKATTLASQDPVSKSTIQIVEEPSPIQASSTAKHASREGTLPPDDQLKRVKKSTRVQNPRALVVTKLSNRLQRLKRWVIDCHVMYKMLH